MRSSRSRYAVALLAAAAALGLRALLDPWLGDRLPYITLFGAVIVAAWHGGTGPALFAATAGYLAADFAFVLPRGAFTVWHAGQGAGLVAYTISTALIAALAGAMHAQRRRAQAAVAQVESTEERFRKFMEYLPAMVFVKDQEGRYVFMNRAAESFLELPQDGWAGKTDAELLPQAEAREIVAHDQRVLAADTPESFDLTIARGDGERRFHSTKFPLRDSAGQRFVGSVTIDVTEERRTEEALREADRRKDEFLATLAHELRNPLAPIRNAVAILSRKGPLEPELAWSRDVIERQVRQMSRLIDDLLDIARISSGKLSVRKQRVPLALVIDMALETSRPHIDAAGHRLEVRLPAQALHVDADETRLAQVFSNLLNNAAKYTARGGAISVSAAQRGADAVVSVTDNGIGFPAEMESRLFQPFLQSPDADTHAPGGLGIGLALARGIVLLHGGGIEARSAGKGKGSEFVVRLPLAAPEAREHASPEPREPVRVSGLRVLVADDNRDAADSLRRILEIEGHEVRVAYDGVSALHAGEEFRPRVAVLDIGMPGANGYDVARGLRTKFERAIELIALTGWGQEADRRRAAEAGFDHHLTKPVDPEKLARLLEAVANR